MCSVKNPLAPIPFSDETLMMVFDFDTTLDRRASDSMKWQKYAGRDVLPMWVADMDFKSPPAVIEALHRRVDHGIFGYTQPLKSTINAVVESLEKSYRWSIDPAWLVWLPGLVVGLNVTAQACAQPGEEVLCLAPNYPPFMSAPANSGRISRTVSVVLNRGARRWEIDWSALEEAVTPRTKVFFLCHPHNPLSRVWRREELDPITAFCLRHNLYLCSDEIHSELILDPALSHLPVGTLDPQIADKTITLISPSKTFNLAGLGTSIAIIQDPNLRARFVRVTSGIVPLVNPMGYVACEAAYREGEPWRQALLVYLRSNRDFLLNFLREEIPSIKIEAPIEATYLAWLNIKELNLLNPAAHFENHGIGLSDGAAFGAPKGEYMRLNFGCPRPLLAEGLLRLKSAASQVRTSKPEFEQR
jgi:cysteine-S-conjugate beta-lyase